MPQRTTPAAGARDALRAFGRFALLHGCVRSWLWVHFAVDVPRAGLVAAACVATAAFALVWHPRAERIAPRVALPALLAQLALTFPTTDNHFFLELYAVGLLCLQGPGDEVRALVRSALQALAAIVLFHTGLQKVLYGQYFGGEFLAFMIGQGERFALPFEWIVSADEVARLRGYDALRSGQGPYRVDSALFVALSNAVWIAEIALAAGLAFARTRIFAACGALALVAAIQLGAREFGFALLFANLLLLFTERAGSLALPLFAAVEGLALAAAIGGLPGGAWIEPGSL